jgi:hypothetical protein|uniref:Uncharacterized protein n=1 Tax=viral metagenome TaxID=1070528 RepID=A0A6C0DYB4_9ZZZZ
MNETAVLNRGTGAGGANTNHHGKRFEEKTNNRTRLLDQGYTRESLRPHPKKETDYCLKRTDPDTGITNTFVEQHGLKCIMKADHDKQIFRCPDEAYMKEYPDGRKALFVLEKKEQRVEGSVETKLWSGPSLKREYELVLGPGFNVFYGFCVSEFLKRRLVSHEKKYEILHEILGEHNIVVLFGDDDNYFETLDAWISNSL